MRRCTCDLAAKIGALIGKGHCNRQGTVAKTRHINAGDLEFTRRTRRRARNGPCSDNCRAAARRRN